MSEYAEALANIGGGWTTFPTEVKREILGTYVPDGFMVQEGRKLMAEVCGYLLDENIEILPPPTKGQPPARHAKPQDARKKDSQTVEAGLATCSDPPFLQGGKVGAAGFEPTTPCTPSKCATKLRYAPTG